METGLGGRLDPTNQISPDVCILTPIDIDHTARLGTTLAKIAEEKSGIIKAGIPVVSATQHPEVGQVIRTHCNSKDAPLITTKRCADCIALHKRGRFLCYVDRKFRITSIGLVQPQNAALCIETARLLNIPARLIQRALKKTRLPGRAQIMGKRPKLLIDGAHNPAATKALCDTIDAYFPKEKKVLLFACMADKDAANMAALLGGPFHFCHHYPHRTKTAANRRNSFSSFFKQYATQAVSHAGCSRSAASCMRRGAK